MMKDEFSISWADRGTLMKRPRKQRYSRAISWKMRKYSRREQPNAAYLSPGRGVSGESTN